MKYDLTKIVDRAVASFEKNHPKFELTDSARSMLAAHADRKRETVLFELKAGKTSPDDLAKGLEQMLTYAASLRKRPLVVKIGKKSSLGGTFSVGGAGPSGAMQLTVPVLRTAMKKKCKTFPWC